MKPKTKQERLTDARPRAGRCRARERADRRRALTLPPTAVALFCLAGTLLFAPGAFARQPRRRQPARPAAAQQQQQRVPADALLRIVRAEDERRWDADDLGALLSDPSAPVRARAALAAGRVGDARAVAPLAALLSTEKSIEVRARAAFALGEIESAPYT